MKLVTLIENTAQRPDLAAEHGLSLYIEACGKHILFDAGQSGAFADNAEKLGVDLSLVDLAVLSHGHYDHGGGLFRFLEVNGHAPVYVNRHAFEPHYNAAGKDIGLDPKLPRQRLRFVDDFWELASGLTLQTVPFLPEDTAGLMMDGHMPEDFRHEQYLLIEENGKRILVTGCSHKGVVPLAEHFRPDILIGGFHFMKLRDRERLRDAGERLAALDCTCYTGHCTGQEQYEFLKTILGPRLHQLSGTAHL